MNEIIADHEVVIRSQWVIVHGDLLALGGRACPMVGFPCLCRFVAFSPFSPIMASKYVRKIDFSNIIASPAQQEFLLAEYRKDKNTNLGGRRGPYPDGRFWDWCNQKLKEAKMGHIEPRGSAKTAPTTGRAKPKAVSGVKRKAAAEETASAETETDDAADVAEKEHSSAGKLPSSVLIMQDFQNAMQQAHAAQAVPATVSVQAVQAVPANAEMVAINTKCITDEQVQLQRQEALLKQPDTPAGLFMGAALAVQLGLCKSPGEYMVS